MGYDSPLPGLSAGVGGIMGATIGSLIACEPPTVGWVLPTAIPRMTPLLTIHFTTEPGGEYSVRDGIVNLVNFTPASSHVVTLWITPPMIGKEVVYVKDGHRPTECFTVRTGIVTKVWITCDQPTDFPVNVWAWVRLPHPGRLRASWFRHGAPSGTHQAQRVLPA
jgi:hypothetical protein